jgi:phage terminase large subunit-like protein
VLTLVEDGDYRYDAAAAERPVTFIEKYCRHYEGKFAGEPFKLHPLQARIVRDVYGWKWRTSGLRRFTDVYFEAAVGAGKSPLLAALGLFGLMADGEKGAQVYCLASTFSQARVVFDCAKRMGTESPALAARLVIVNNEIRHPASGSFWRILSGKGPGAGCRATTVLADEVHEWANGKGYQALRDRMSKREQPLIWCATNAGEHRTSFCWQLRERATAALAGRGDAALYPVIWSAPEGASTADPAAWRAANPLIGTTIALAKVEAKAAEAASDPETEAQFRRLYLGIWPKQGTGKWLDLALWDRATGPVDPPPGCTLFVGVDLSQGGDLCAVVYVWLHEGRFYVRSHFWLPRATAELYEGKHAIPYAAWAAAGHVTLLAGTTVDAADRAAIAAHVVTTGKPYKVRAVAYDRYKADETVVALELAGLTCVPVAQGYTLSPGCSELVRRLAEGGATIAANPVLRFCAENAEVTQDTRGNIWPVKPMAKGRYAGKRELKIDGISALVTALTEARKAAMEKPKPKWKGTVCVL